MAGITQTIPNYVGGISEQPDQLKVPGQVKSTQNSIPDVVHGLYKRPGSKRLGASPLTNVQSGGSWFHYYRDETEGSYIGQVAANGRVRMWKCSDGTEKNVWYHTDNAAYDGSNSDHTSITSYLTPNPSSDSEDIQALTINDTTFLNNRSKTVATTGTTTGRPHKNFAYIELSRSENGRQYALNIYDDTSTQSHNVATKIKIKSDTLDEGNGTGTCPGIGTQVFSVNTVVEHTIPTSGVNTSTDVITKSDHGWSNGQAIKYWSIGGAVITGLSDQTVYYVIDATTNTFKVSASSGGGSISLSGTGNNSQIFSELTGEVISITNSAGVRYTGVGTRDNLIFRVSALGQQGVNPSASNVNSGADYRCSYNREVNLLHGGEGWITGDEVVVALDTAQTTYNYTIRIEDHETASITTNVKAVRPTPTPFDADTSVTIDAILGGITSELSGVTVNSNPLLSKVVGNGIYIYTAADADDFNVEIVDQDLMRVMQTEINDVQSLPFQCVHGAIVKISNTRASDEDDYYVKFNGENGKDGPGSWVECAEPGIVKSFNAATMPHMLQRQADGDFLIKQYTYSDREVGDNVTNPIPSFVGGTINKVIFFRNRLVFLSGENVVTSRPGSIATPNFWSNTALTVSASDPIDISCSSNYPSDLFDAIEINSGLLCFSSNAQFLLASDDTVMNPDTAKLRAVSWFNYNTVIPPISLGQTVGWVDNSNKYSRFMETANVVREGAPVVQDTSKIVPTLLPKDIDLFTNSKENNLVFFGKTDSDTVIGYRYLRTGDKQILSSWFKWKHNNPLKYHFIINDQYFLLDTDNFLQSINLVQADTDPSIDQDDVNYLIHLDNFTTISGGVYSSTTNLTTFTNQSDWIDDVTTPNGTLVVVDTDSNTARAGRYAECTVINTDDFTVPGNWDYNVEHVILYTALNASNEQITLTTGSTDHGLETGDKIRWVEGDSAAGGLTDGTVYYVIDASVNNIALASNLSNANAGVAVNITSQGTGNHKIQKLITDLHIGYLYEYNVEFPRFYLQKAQDETVTSDVNSKLTVHRMKLNFGKIGLYETTLTRVGKSAYTEVYESTDLDEYDASDAPYLSEKIKDIPVYERNMNVSVILKSSHPSPAILRSMTWEGDWTPQHYRRV